jgi:hypothetical protein
VRDTAAVPRHRVAAGPGIVPHPGQMPLPTCEGEAFIMTGQALRIHALAAGILLAVVSGTRADELCTDRIEFERDGWQLEPVQQAMDDYLRDHGMRVNWLQEPRPPSAVGRNYYEWLWTHDFGVGMKAELVQRFCAGAPSAGTGDRD